MADQPTAEEITDTEVSEELNDSFLEYAMSVIVARALPDVRDGLKPVHRRILYSLDTQGIRPDGAHKKCAKAVGHVVGSYHPHGDSAVYEALVRLGQPWSMRVPLVDGHGNFGSLDDPPAAMRYTEAKMAPSATHMVGELGEDTVDFEPNYDATDTEPVVLPAAFPNMLVNGGTGIAVGMATSMAPHHPGEVIAGLQAMLDNPDIDLDQLMEHIPGPDLPSGGLVIGADGIRQAYETGRGSFKMRAVAAVEDVSARRKGIVITALPYTVGPEKVIARIKDLVGAKKLTGISDVKDFSDRKTGLKLVVECKAGFNPQAVLAQLYRQTPLEESFSINNVVLVEGQPQTLGLLALCRHFLNHRREVVRRRTEHRLRKAEARAHVVEGLLVAMDAIDEVVAIIRGSKSTRTAKEKLRKRFELSEVQAQAILDMTLSRLTSLEVGKLRAELAELSRRIRELRALLGSSRKLDQQISDELAAVGEQLADERRTTLLASAPQPEADTASVEIADDDCVVALSATGLIGRFAPGPVKGRKAKHDVLLAQLATTARAPVGLLTDTGRLLRLPACELPEAGSPSRGLKVDEVFDLQAGETPVALLDARPARMVALATASGRVKRVRTDDFPQRTEPRPIIRLEDGDVVVAAGSCGVEQAEQTDLVLVSSDAKLLRIDASSVAPKGLAAGGLAGMKLGAGAQVLAFALVDDADSYLVATATDAAAVKVSPVGLFPRKGRGTGGVRAMTFKKADSCLVAAGVGLGPLVAAAASGAPVAYDATPTKRDASGTAVDTPIVRFGTTRR